MRERFVDKVKTLLGYTTTTAEVVQGRVRLSLNGDQGPTTHMTDHIIACTGYEVDLRKLRFLSDGIRSGIRSIQNTPILSASFESSVPGLYFVGSASANSFGPMMRFTCGADWTAHRIAHHLAKAEWEASTSEKVQDVVTLPANSK
jgi:hypothetical protein